MGLAAQGIERSGAALLRPANTPANAPAGFAGGSDGGSDGNHSNGEVTADLLVPSDGKGGIYSLSKLLFPRFNLLCLPDLPATDSSISATAINNQYLSAAISYCTNERAFLIVDTPRDISKSPPTDWYTDPPSLGGLSALGEHAAIYFPRLIQV